MGRVRPETLAALSQIPEVARQVRQVAAQIRDQARAAAPKDTGRGARSITVERVYDREARDVSYRVSWRRDRFYMRFQETGWTHVGGRHISGKHFLEQAAERFRR